MAGRIVVFEFKTAADAEEFVQKKTQIQHNFGMSAMAMFVKPSKFCECEGKRRQNASNWVKGKRTGLYLCKVCKRPSVHHQTGILDRLKYVFGHNLLEAER